MFNSTDPDEVSECDPEVEDECEISNAWIDNVRNFLSFVAADGYNQLTVATSFFKIRDPVTIISSRVAD